MKIRTHQGSEFYVCAIDDLGQERFITLPFYSNEDNPSWFKGDLTDANHLRILAAIIDWAEENGVILDLDID
tara:strand:- start:441 stop:656 length:216 start_codon:yes stop_codon:yes gene_type:complete